MQIRTTISLYNKPETAELIRAAAKELSLTDSAFCRMVAVEKAKQVLNKKEADSHSSVN